MNSISSASWTASLQPLTLMVANPDPAHHINFSGQRKRVSSSLSECTLPTIKIEEKRQGKLQGCNAVLTGCRVTEYYIGIGALDLKNEKNQTAGNSGKVWKSHSFVYNKDIEWYDRWKENPSLTRTWEMNLDRRLREVANGLLCYTYLLLRVLIIIDAHGNRYPAILSVD